MKYLAIFLKGEWKLLSILLLFVFISGCYIGTTSFSGKILEKDTGAPISNALLEFLQRVTTTEEDGSFLFLSIPYGIHTLFIKAPFYRDMNFIIDIDKPYFSLSSPIFLEPFSWSVESEGYLYKADDLFSIYASYDGVNFSEENILPWGKDLIERIYEVFGTYSEIPYKVYVSWKDDNVNFENTMAYTFYNDGEIHILKRTVELDDIDKKREIYAHELVHLFLYRFTGITEPYIQEGIAYYLPSFVFNYGEKYSYAFYKKGLLYYLTPSYIPSWKEAGKIYGNPEHKRIFWFSVFELRSIFYFLSKKYGEEKIIKFIEVLKRMRDNPESAFIEVFGKDVESLEEEWKEFFKLPGYIEKVGPPPVVYIY